MKQCPKCNADYFDNMLEFCLEDGTRLTFAPNSAAATTPLVRPVLRTNPPPGPLSEHVSQETVVIPGDKPVPDTVDVQGTTLAAKWVEMVPIALALAHNWWQWLYLEKTPTYSIADYLLSANFLMWLLLLAAGVAAGVYSVNRSRDKTLAIISLVALAINLILYLVPRR